MNIRKLLLENSISDNVQILYNHLSGSRDDNMVDMAYTHYHEITSFLENNYDEDLIKQVTEGTDEQFEIIDKLNEMGKRDILISYGEYVLDYWQELHIPDAEMPSWFFFTDPKLIRNNWLIHFTDHAWDVIRNGFTKGMYDINRLGLTTSYTDSAKKYGGYNFAYYYKDLPRGTASNYGSEAVIFKASGVRVWHVGDEEYQTIFWGADVDKIILLETDYNEWVIPDEEGEPIIQSENIEDIIGYLEKN